MAKGLACAGFWRRLWSSAIDFVIILAPFQFVAVWLFVGTAGHVQMAGGIIKVTRCNEVHAVPDGLVPPPPEGWNVAKDCWTSLLGAATAHKLTVARAIKFVSIYGNTTFSVSQTYALDAQGEQVKAFDLDNLTLAALLIYLVAMKSLTGQSVGDRAAGVRLVEVINESRPGPPVWRMVARYLAMTLGFLPAIAWLGFIGFEYGAAFFEHASATLFLVLGGIAAVWALVNVILIVRKTDPIYDRICGVSVRRI
jgi:hypothetical protein